jgi:deazaflavin-dependent oxidoreductase (nitroreductase family)
VEWPRFARPLTKAMMGLGHALFRLFPERMRVQGRPLLLLTTVGAKTSRRRETVLGWFPDPRPEDAWLVVGSAGGSARHPGWYFNLAKNPDQVWIRVGRRELRVRPESLKGAEREEAWNRVVSMAPGYGLYQVKTDREIPIVRLTPLD